MSPCNFVLSHPHPQVQLALSSEQYLDEFKVARNKLGKRNPCASNFSTVLMHRLDSLILKVGGFELSTPASSSSQPVTVGKDAELWWQVKRKVLEVASPTTMFGTEEPWHPVRASKLCIMMPAFVGSSSSSPGACFTETNN